MSSFYLPVTPAIPSRSLSESKSPRLLSSVLSVLIIVFFPVSADTILFTSVPVRNWKLLVAVEFCVVTTVLDSECVEQGEHGSGVWTPDPRPQFSLLAGGDSKKLVTTSGSVWRMTSGGVVCWGEIVSGCLGVRTSNLGELMLVVVEELMVTWGCMVFEARLTIIEV